MGVILTEKAASEVKKIMTEQNLPEEAVLRVGVQGGGCSGFAYSLNFDTSTSERDRVVDVHGVKLAVDKNLIPTSMGRSWIFTTVSRSVVLFSITPTWSRVAAAVRRSRFEPGHVQGPELGHVVGDGGWMDNASKLPFTIASSYSLPH